MSEPSAHPLPDHSNCSLFSFTSGTVDLANARGIDLIVDQKDEEKATDGNFILHSTTFSNRIFRITVYL